jgi:hypothetical protein
MEDTPKKLNCWEFKKCGFECCGKKTYEIGAVCPAAACYRMDEIHGGKNGGRCCWAIANTFCGGDMEEAMELGISIGKKMKNKCQNCDFYIRVIREEKNNFTPISVLIHKLKRNDNG